MYRKDIRELERKLRSFANNNGIKMESIINYSYYFRATFRKWGRYCNVGEYIEYIREKGVENFYHDVVKMLCDTFNIDEIAAEDNRPRCFPTPTLPASIKQIPNYLYLSTSDLDYEINVKGNFAYPTVKQSNEVLNFSSVTGGYALDMDIHSIIENVIFNPPATIVIWKDKTKTVVKCGEGDIFDAEKGLAMAISKKVMGNKGKYYETFKKWLPEKDEVSKSCATCKYFDNLMKDEPCTSCFTNILIGCGLFTLWEEKSNVETVEEEVKFVEQSGIAIAEDYVDPIEKKNNVEPVTDTEEKEKALTEMLESDDNMRDESSCIGESSCMEESVNVKMQRFGCETCEYLRPGEITGQPLCKHARKCLKNLDKCPKKEESSCVESNDKPNIHPKGCWTCEHHDTDAYEEPCCKCSVILNSDTSYFEESKIKKFCCGVCIHYRYTDEICDYYRDLGKGDSEYVINLDECPKRKKIEESKIKRFGCEECGQFDSDSKACDFFKDSLHISDIDKCSKEREWTYDKSECEGCFIHDRDLDKDGCDNIINCHARVLKD